MATGNTFNAMVSQIVFELGRRTDLQATVVPRAINDAIQIYQKERFRFNELQPLSQFSFNTVQGQPFYGEAADARIPLLMKVDHLNYLLNSTVEEIERTVPQEIILALQANQQAGPPSSWAWEGDEIMIYPAPPAQVYQITVWGYLAVAGPEVANYGTDTTNPWMNAAERLIRARAKYEIALNVTRDPKMIAAMSPDEPAPGEQGGAVYRYYNELKSEANKIKGTSRVRAMPF